MNTVGRETALTEWLEQQRTVFGMVRALRLAGSNAQWPAWMIVSPEDVTIELPFTPPCRHLTPHRTRPVETEDALASYLVFKNSGWETAGYCWHYVPAFLHEWYGCGPDQELFTKAASSPTDSPQKGDA